MDTPDPEDPVDAEALAEIRGVATEAGPGVFAHLLKVFLSDAGRHLDELRAAAAAVDAGKAALEAHTLRGSTGNFGARRMSRLAKEIEEAARAGRVEGLQSSVAAAAAEFGRVREALEPLAHTTDDRV